VGTHLIELISPLSKRSFRLFNVSFGAASQPNREFESDGGRERSVGI
jgi:hypothetical protein